MYHFAEETVRQVAIHSHSKLEFTTQMQRYVRRKTQTFSSQNKLKIASLLSSISCTSSIVYLVSSGCSGLVDAASLAIVSDGLGIGLHELQQGILHTNWYMNGL